MHSRHASGNNLWLENVWGCEVIPSHPGKLLRWPLKIIRVMTLPNVPSGPSSNLVTAARTSEVSSTESRSVQTVTSSIILAQQWLPNHGLAWLHTFRRRHRNCALGSGLTGTMLVRVAKTGPDTVGFVVDRQRKRRTGFES